MAKCTVTPIQIRFSDIDRFGHVNNSKIFDYFDLGKLAFYAEAFGDTLNWSDKTLALVSVKGDFLAQTRENDNMIVETRVARIGNKSFSMFQRLINCTTGVCHAESYSTAAGFSIPEQCSIQLLDSWRAAMEEYLIEQ